MDENEYLKCACKECGTHIEFPAEAARTTVICPNCGQWTELLAPETPEKRKGIIINLGWIAALCGVLLLAAGAFWWQHAHAASGDKGPGMPVVSAPKLVAPVVKAPTNPPANVVTQVVEVAPVQPKPKSREDLKVSGIRLEKTPNTSLVYAVGTVTNDSTWQRFGLRIELDLMDAQTKKIGTTQDYKEILEPHQAWEFRALIPEKSTVAAKFGALTEQE
jgi:hypothetical protein